GGGGPTRRDVHGETGPAQQRQAAGPGDDPSGDGAARPGAGDGRGQRAGAEPAAGRLDPAARGPEPSVVAAGDGRGADPAELTTAQADPSPLPAVAAQERLPHPNPYGCAH